MNFAFFHVPVFSPEPHSSDLNHFLQEHANAIVDRQLIIDGQNSAWAICCQVPGTSANQKSRSEIQRTTGKNSPDYKELLDPDTFARFAKLRELRKTHARDQDIPVYAIFSNAQLAQMAELDPLTRESMAAIDGIGEKRVERFADLFINALQES